LPYTNAEWEKLSIFLNFLVPKLPAPKEEDLSKGILESIERKLGNKFLGIKVDGEIVGAIGVSGGPNGAERRRLRESSPRLRTHTER
jgi:hypothetical protein